MRPWTTAALMAFGCSGGSDSPGGPTLDGDTASTVELADDDPAWWVTGQEGNIAFVHTLQSANNLETFDVSGLFGASLQSLEVASHCAVVGALCFGDRPAEVGGSVGVADLGFDPTGTELAWVGWDLGLGTTRVPFFYDPETELAYYYLEVGSEFVAIQGVAADIQVAGEWGDYVGSNQLILPAPAELIEPDPMQYVRLEPGETVLFQWEPAKIDVGELYLDVSGPGGFHQLFRLDDTGEYDFDPSVFGVLEIGDLVTFELIRWFETEAFVNGNHLVTQGISRQPVHGALSNPASCEHWYQSDGSLDSGVYLIQPHPEENPVEVWCDMETDGGGWTLVASTATTTLNDEAASYYFDLGTLHPVSGHTGIWSGMRTVITDNSDIRFACKADIDGTAMDADVSFYDIHWYREITTGSDTESCFNEGQGAGADDPPERRDNLTGDTRPAGDQWNAGYLEGEDLCSSEDDFTIDFDDRGMDSNTGDGTDWGEDDDVKKCGTHASLMDGAWFIFVRETR